MRIVATRTYERAAKRLLSDSERVAAETEIASAPERWPIIPGTSAARKARIALAGRGKSGGARMIYFYHTAEGAVVLFDVYAKNTKEDLSGAEKRDLKKAIAEILAPQTQ